MSTLQQYISVIGIFQGGLLFVLLSTDSRVSSAGRVLSVLCLFLAALLFLPFILSGSVLQSHSWLAAWLWMLPASFGGLSYVYVKNSLLNKKFSWRDAIHLAPLIASYILTLDFLVYEQEELLAWIAGRRTDSWRINSIEYLIFAQAFFYTAIAAALIKRYQNQAHNKLANFNPATFKWLWGFVLIGLVIWCLKAVLSFAANIPIAVVYISDMMIVAFIYFIAMAQWRNPELFIVNQLNDHEPQSEAQADDSGDRDRGALDDSTRAQLFNAVKNQVEAEHLYRDSELTLVSLAQTTGLSTHHLSEVLNQYEGKNFYKFINNYRISHVCERLKEDDTSKIIDIALDAGFASKSTFNAIFKKFTGSTPSQYRKALAS